MSPSDRATLGHVDSGLRKGGHGHHHPARGGCGMRGRSPDLMHTRGGGLRRLHKHSASIWQDERKLRKSFSLKPKDVDIQKQQQLENHLHQTIAKANAGRVRCGLALFQSAHKEGEF